MPIGVYISQCSGALEPTLNAQRLASAIEDGVAVVRIVDDLFSADLRDAVRSDVQAHGLDGVVLAGTSPDRLIKSLSGRQVTDSVAEAGINPNRIAFANLLEQVALVHGDDIEGAHGKAKALLEAALAHLAHSAAVEAAPVDVVRGALFLGATPEAVIAAQRLLRSGYQVVIADRGNVRAALDTTTGLRGTLSYVLGHERLTAIDDAALLDGHGWIGDFHCVLGTPEGPHDVSVGAIIVSRPDDEHWVRELRDHFRVDVDDEGHARSIDPVLHPAETVNPGIYVLESLGIDAVSHTRVSTADAVALSVLLDTDHGEVVHYQDVSEVDDTLCGGCAVCVRTCAFGACSLGEDGLSHVDARRCRACGKCVVACAVGARDIVSSPHGALLASVRALSQAEVSGPRVLGFLCGGCGYPAADDAAKHVAERGSYPTSFLPLRIPCGGRLDALYVLEAFRSGFDAVSVYRCKEGHCHNLIGNLDMDRRINLLRTILRSRGIDDDRLRIVDISPDEGIGFLESVDEVCAAAKGGVA